jgi:vitamin B12 transporter
MKTKILLLSTIVSQTLLLGATESLGEIDVISVNKTKTSIKETTSDISVITQTEISEKGYKSVLEAIGSMAGINTAQSGGIGQKSSFFLRGLDSGKILVLVDGMRLNDPSTTNNTAMLEFLTVANIERIEIIKGGVSSIWGANASAGVINIITKDSEKDGLSGAIGLNGGSHGTKVADFSLFNKKGNLNSKLMGSIQDTNGISALAPQKSEKDGYTNKNILASIGYDFTKDTKASITVNKTKTKGNFDDTWSAAQANDDYSRFDTDSTNILGSISTKIGAVDSILNISRGDYDREYFTPDSGWGTGDNKYKAIVDEYSLINSYQYSLGKSVFGLEYKKIDGFNQYNSYAPTEGSFSNKAIFLANTVNPTDKLLIEANLRYDNFDKFNSKTTYKFGAKYDLPNGVTMKANCYTSLNAPSVYQLSNVVSGNELKPSFTTGYDVSLSYSEFLSLTYFDNKVKDDIIYDYVNWGYYNNSTDEKIRGIEIAAKTPIIFDRFAGKANYTHLIDMRDESGMPLYNRAKDQINMSVDYFYDESTIAALDAQYIGKRVSYGNIQTGNYVVWNLNFTKQFNDKFDLGLHVKNLFDKDYQTIAGYNSEGRSVYADVRYRF